MIETTWKPKESLDQVEVNENLIQTGKKVSFNNILKQKLYFANGVDFENF